MHTIINKMMMKCVRHMHGYILFFAFLVEFCLELSVLSTNRNLETIQRSTMAFDGTQGQSAIK